MRCRCSVDEPELIQLLVRRILHELSKTPMDVAPYIVGHRHCIEDLIKLLDVNPNGLQFLGLYGMGGIGKTTLAKALFNKIVANFERRSFISNVRDIVRQNGIDSLKNKLRNDLSLKKRSQSSDVKEIHNREKVFIVFDDVDDPSQLSELLATCRREWFYEGSQIVITTRNRDVLVACDVKDVYEVKQLNPDDSLELFLYHAKPTKTFLDLSRQIVSLTKGLPLAVEVFGSFLFDKRKTAEWEEALEKLKKIRPGYLQDVLRISFDGLKVEEKSIFLDMSCLFIELRMKREDVMDVLNGCGFKAVTSINVLVARSLLRVTEDGESFSMHDQIRDMGRQIVQLENTDFGKRSRLWDCDEVSNVLQNGTGTGCVEGIILAFGMKDTILEKSAKSSFGGRFPWITSAIRYLKEYFYNVRKDEEQGILNTKSFQPMDHLRLLHLKNARFEGSFKCMSPELKWLQWKHCPLDNLPSSFRAPQLTVLDVSESKIKKVWGEEWWRLYKSKVAEKLMVMKLYHCYSLTVLPNLARHPALEKLVLEGCINLTTLNNSLGDLTELRHLNLKGCSKLVKFPNYVSGLKNLETLVLSGCTKLKTLPPNLCSLNSLRELYINQTAIEELPDTVFWLTKLEVLRLDDCRFLKKLPLCIGQLTNLRTLSASMSALEELPDSICLLRNLETLNLILCKSLTALPEDIGNLKSLAEFLFSGSSVRELPASIGLLSNLKNLFVGNCCSLVKLPLSIGSLASVIQIYLDRLPITSLPDQVDGLKSLKQLEIRNCESLQLVPDSIGCILTLTKLTIVRASIMHLPESIGRLENLSMLTLSYCPQLSELPSSFGNLKSLKRLYMDENAVTKLPETFGMLSLLVDLNMTRKTSEDVDTEPYSQTVLPDSFSNLSLLENFNARSWNISGKISDDFEKLSSLGVLNLSHNDFQSLPASLTGLSVLKELFLQFCKTLKAIPSLPSSLGVLNAGNCMSLEIISDLSHLEKLRDLNLTDCGKLRAVPGLQQLKALRRLHMSGCTSCSSETISLLDKLALRNLYNLSLPGNKIPEWFSLEPVSYSKPRNLTLKSILIALVISVNHEKAGNLRDPIRFAASIQTKILRSNEPIHSTAPNLGGVPKTDEDNFYLCRYNEHRPLVKLLRDGDLITVGMRDPPYAEGIEITRWGIHMVFEKDDDYIGDEESLPESYQSVSHKLINFIESLGQSSQILEPLLETCVDNR